MGQIIYPKRDYPTTGKIVYPSRKGVDEITTIYTTLSDLSISSSTDLIDKFTELLGGNPYNSDYLTVYRYNGITQPSQSNQGISSVITDRNHSTGYTTGTQYNGFILDFKKTINITSIAIGNNGVRFNRCYGSNNLSNWTLIFSSLPPVGSVDGIMWGMTALSNVNFQYIGIYSNGIDSSTLTEIKIYGTY